LTYIRRRGGRGDTPGDVGEGVWGELIGRGITKTPLLIMRGEDVSKTDQRKYV
jgi:hypothetical protein